jgi:hypothetical protein
MSLILSEQPGFTEIPDTTFDAGNVIAAATMKALNAAAKFAVVRDEQFWGFYKHGETVALPTSPADGYTYQRSELRYTWSWFWTGAAPGSALAGTQTTPSRGATSGQGHLLEFGADVVQATGVISTDVHYHKDGGSQTDTHDGILMVVTHAQRSR